MGIPHDYMDRRSVLGTEVPSWMLIPSMVKSADRDSGWLPMGNRHNSRVSAMSIAERSLDTPDVPITYTSVNRIRGHNLPFN